MPACETEVTPKPRRRFRVGLRGWIALVLLAALALGGFARQDRLARLQTARLAELGAANVYENHFRPTFLCFAAMRVLGLDSRKTEQTLTRWLDPGWFSYPLGFNAGMLPDEKVAGVVEKVAAFGRVYEVRFDRPPLVGLRLFYVDEVPYNQLGVPREAVTVKDHSSALP